MNHPPLQARDCVRRITQASALPLLVDADTGWGGALMIARTIREISRAGAAGCHLEDQVQAKRCGHRPGKELVSAGEMGDRIKAAVDARTDEQFVIMGPAPTPMPARDWMRRSSGHKPMWRRERT